MALRLGAAWTLAAPTTPVAKAARWTASWRLLSRPFSKSPSIFSIRISVPSLHGRVRVRVALGQSCLALRLPSSWDSVVYFNLPQIAFYINLIYSVSNHSHDASWATLTVSQEHH